MPGRITSLNQRSSQLWTRETYQEALSCIKPPRAFTSHSEADGDQSASAILLAHAIVAVNVYNGASDQQGESGKIGPTYRRDMSTPESPALGISPGWRRSCSTKSP